MEQPHTSEQLDYLEQKYLEGQENVARLQQKTESQAYELQEQARRIEKLETELAEARTQLASAGNFDEQLARLKGELLQVLEQQTGDRQQGSVDPGRALATQLDTHTQALHKLQRDVEKTHRYEEQISLTRTEIERLNKAISTLQAQFAPLKKQLDERDQAAAYLEEQRRTDARRIAELQAELPELHKKIETSLSKIQAVEQQIPQFGKYEFALSEVREEVRRHREHMDFQIGQRERLMKNWNELAEDLERRMKEYESLIEKYAEHYQLNKRALASLQDFQERLQREQHQTVELQRLAEERQRAEIEKWQGEYAQRWQKQVMEWKPQLADLQKSIDVLKKQLAGTANFKQAIEKQIDMILQIIEEDVYTRTMATQEWQRRFEEIANGQE